MFKCWLECILINLNSNMKKSSQKKIKSKSKNKYKIPIPDFIDVTNNINNNNHNNIDLNKIKKFDNHKLKSLLDDLINKDLEYDLIIQGYKEKINTKKRENNFLMKQIQELNKENEDMNNKNKKLNFVQDYKTKEKKIEIKYKNNIDNLNMINLKEKYNQEINRNKEIKDKIIKIKQNINIYKNKLKELETILNNGNYAIEKEEDNMKKFLSEL